MGVYEPIKVYCFQFDGLKISLVDLYKNPLPFFRFRRNAARAAAPSFSDMNIEDTSTVTEESSTMLLFCYQVVKAKAFNYVLVLPLFVQSALTIC